MDEELVICMETQEAMRALCAVNDGDCALLYAYAAASGGHCRLTDAALHTGFDDRRMERAKSLLILYKICRQAGAGTVELTQSGYTPAELLSARQTDPAFSGICDYYEQAVGRSLRKSEFDILYTIYDKLNMPADVLMLLINYCKSKGRLSARELERRAIEWHDKGVTTYGAAADLADEMDRKSAERRRVLSIFGIRDRRPSETEAKYIEAWQAMGMSDEMIRLAYDRTVLRTGKLTWKYLHKILEDWHAKGYHTREQVERAEGTAEAPQPERRPAAPVESVTTVINRRFEEKRQQREALQQRHLEELRRDADFAQNEVELGRLTVQKARAGLSGLSTDREALDRQHQTLLARRQEILRRLGKTEDYISIPPDCPKCGDRGYIGNRMCECFKRACIEEEQRRKQRMAQ